jgi:MOSC domain-containing protein YiiM
MSGQLKAIWIKRMKLGPMDPVQEATLAVDRGIVDNANQGGRRQVTIIEEEVWQQLMGELNSSLDPSVRRANLMVRGIDLKESRGKIIRIGDCRIEIFGETKPCERMDEALPGLKDAMYPQWRGGAFGKVLDSGVIRVGDQVGSCDIDKEE